MAPEYLQGEAIDRRFDVFGMGVVLWEALTGKRLFRGDHEAETLQRVLSLRAPAVSSLVPQATPGLDHVVAAAVEKKREDRFQTAAAMGAALETAAREAGLLASHTDVAALVRAAVGADLDERRTLIRARMATEPALASVGPQTHGPATERDDDKVPSAGGGMNSTLTSAPPTTLPETAPLIANAAPLGSNTAPVIGAATQPLTSPVPTVKDHAGATLISSPPQGPNMNAPRTLSSAPAIVLPEPSNPLLPRASAPARTQPSFDDTSVRIPVRSNSVLYAIGAGVLALAIAGAVIFATASRTSTTATHDQVRVGASASAAGAPSVTAATPSASVVVASAGPSATSAKTIAATSAQRHVTGAYAPPTGSTPRTPVTTAPPVKDAPPPNPY